MPIVAAETFAQTSFDYIIVGGGTAGLVVAARLSEDPGVLVGIVEAGEYLPDREDINVPGYFGRTIGSDIDWKFETVPQPGLNGRKILMSRGKVLGGTSAINFMANTRGSAADYDSWEKLGMSGWNWREILRSLLTAEHRTPAVQPAASACQFNPECHGSSGPLISSYPNYVNDKHTEFLAAVRASGLKENLDPDNGHNVGAWTFGGSIDPRTATRSYAATAYWAPNADRTNLLLVTSAHALKVTFAPSTSAGQNNELCVAQGVQLTAHRDGTILHATARRAIILSAGAIQTPQLLELSGIGNPAILREYDIECVVDLPGVGENLQDHIYIPMSYEVTADCDTWDDTRDPSKHAELWAQYLQQKGKYSHMHSAVAMTGLPILAGSQQRLEEHLASATRHANGPVEDYAKQHALLAGYLGEPGQAQAEIIQAPGFASFASQLDVGKRYHSHINIFLRPFSRGHVHIASPDPHAAPSIDPRYFSHPLDFGIFMDMVRYSRRLMRTAPIAGYFLRHVDPGSDLCDAELEEHVRQQATTLWHPVGTAAMLPREDNGVVDERLRVYGTANLHVVRSGCPLWR
ncbi:alcohol oxidase [Exidia glandulosa HHB12029]|uniref:Alcohol oxidase n=1 Tax=Exidia glandulosa HHB12029 TaxID=1314781 RepID=A0A165D8V9_EXIGL|nr:alcohol oxidase [Exidia glandulosa HHB12029]